MRIQVPTDKPIRLLGAGFVSMRRCACSVCTYNTVLRVPLGFDSECVMNESDLETHSHLTDRAALFCGACTAFWVNFRVVGRVLRKSLL